MKKVTLCALLLSTSCVFLSGFYRERCGDGSTDPDEQCDDGNTINRDGCDELCQLESLSACGDGFLDVGEECDDGNTINSDGCDELCQVERCGDGSQQGAEQCDDGNFIDGDGCDANCTITSCGNGITTIGEECDDGNLIETDTCTNACQRPTIVDISAGFSHTCARTQFGAAKCWGANGAGQLGQGNNISIGDDETPQSISAIPLNEELSKLTLGQNFACAIIDFGSVRCWGANNLGQLGLGSISNIGDNELVSSINPLDLKEPALQITSGLSHTCIQTISGGVVCWGNNASGQLGYGDTNNLGDDEAITATFVDLAGQTNSVVQITAGGDHTCVLLSNGNIRCWGLNTSGQLGYGHTNNIGDEAAESIQSTNISLNNNARQISAGREHTCALLNDESVICWGLNTSGQLGLGNTDSIGDDELPTNATIIGQPVLQLALGTNHTCVLLSDGLVKCWGANGAGQLGQGNTERFGDNVGETPAALPPINLGDLAVQITSRGAYACALLQDGRVTCWGNNNVGQLGYGTTDNVGDDETPSAVGPVPAF